MTNQEHLYIEQEIAEKILDRCHEIYSSPGHPNKQYTVTIEVDECVEIRKVLNYLTKYGVERGVFTTMIQEEIPMQKYCWYSNFSYWIYLGFERFEAKEEGPYSQIRETENGDVFKKELSMAIYSAISKLSTQ